MIKYYIIDEATSEKQEASKDDFLSSLIYNLDVAVQYKDMTTYDALCNLKFIMNQGEKKKKFSSIAEVNANGFIYQVEA